MVSIEPAPAEGACSECGGALPRGRRRGRCMACVAALGRAAQAGRKSEAADLDPLQVEMRALSRCAAALAAVPEPTRVRVLRYLWAVYSGPGASKDNGTT